MILAPPRQILPPRLCRRCAALLAAGRLPDPWAYMATLGRIGSSLIVQGGKLVTDCTCCACGGCAAAAGNECGHCDVGAAGKTPSRLHLMFKAGTVGSPLCTRDGGAPCRVWQVICDSTVTSGSLSIQLDQDATDKCLYQKVYTSAWPITIKKCFGSCTGCDCTPTIDVATKVTIFVQSTGGLCRDPKITVEHAEPFGSPTTIGFAGFSTTNCAATCCADDDRDGSASTGAEDWNSLVNGGYVITPC